MPRVIAACLAGALALWLAACGGASQPADDAAQSRYQAINEAYELLDKGETARAIHLLEDILRDNPDHDEANVVLASAYMGKAGIDVLSMHEAFRDVLFSRSLSQVFFGGQGDKKSGGPGPLDMKDPVTGAALPQIQNGVVVTRIEQLLERLDVFLNNVRRVLVILDRFPRVPAQKWPLLDQALLNLNQTALPRDVRLYRMFIRLIYLKEVLVTRVIRDTSFGTRRWACSAELDGVRDAVGWITASLSEISEDFIQVYPQDASPFVRVEALFKALGQTLQQLESATPAGGETASVAGLRRMREALQCGMY